MIHVAVVPNSYNLVARVLGLYPLVRIPFAQGIKAWHVDTVQAFKHFASDGPPDTGTVLYAPAPSPELSPAQVAAIIARGHGHPLGIPKIGSRERALLLATFAPVLQVQTGHDYDRIGALSWGAATVSGVRTTQPTVYGRIAYTRYGDNTLLQLVYTAWFPERPPDSPLDIFAGKLDGIVFRVTLGPHGKPLVYDSVHPCGCYYMFFPTRRVKARLPPKTGNEWAFSPAQAPTLAAGDRILLYIASRTHYLSGIGVYTAPPHGVHRARYDIEPESALLTLPLPEGGTRSVFGPDGLVAGTQRPEHWLFWPMGVPSASTMRQPGARDIAFLGRRHFDDPYLIEQRFRIVDP